jgi:hypothetical protein
MSDPIENTAQNPSMLGTLPLADCRLVPSTEDDILWASRMITRVYEGDDVIPTEVMLDWYRANPDGFWVLKNGKGENIGNLDLLTFRPDTMREFIAGGLLERNIPGACLYTPSEKSLVRDVYIASLVVPANEVAGGPTNCGALLAILNKLPQCIRKMCSQESLERGEVNAYALSANAAITKLLARYRWSILTSKSRRIDAHDLYCVNFGLLESQIIQRVKESGSARRFSRLGFIPESTVIEEV